MTIALESTDGVRLELHDLGGQGPDLLICHATGFHGLVYEPMARRLSERAHCWAPDLRGHGNTALPDGWPMDWQGFCDDVLAVVDHLGGGPLLAVGHSMGGAALLMAEQRRPGAFRAMWLFEPIVVPPGMEFGHADTVMPGIARRRREVFVSREEALDNYRRKPPFDVICEEALFQYVQHGFEDLPNGEVRLKCRGEVEAQVFEAALRTSVYEQLGSVKCPVTVVASGEDSPPRAMAAPAAAALPSGSLREMPGTRHLGPMEDPDDVAKAVVEDLGLGLS